jgi:hypothetical protein
MTEERLTDLVIQITSGIAELNANMKTALGKLADHERRIDDLEKNKLGIKDTVIQWLVKGIVVAVITIGSLTGASALIQKVLAPSTNAITEIQK